jgi:TRAP-type mannitol/chloroaromatic compound transport system permease large subunit
MAGEAGVAEDAAAAAREKAAREQAEHEKAGREKAEYEKAEREKAAGEKSSTESIKLIGGLVALTVGLIILALIAGGAIVAGTATAEKIALGAFGVIGTLVGAYFGQKVGSDGTKEATKLAEAESKKAQQEAVKAQVYAAHLPAGEAPAIVKLAHEVASG